MSNKHLHKLGVLRVALVLAGVVALLWLLGSGVVITHRALAQGPEPQSDVGAQADVGTAFTYQGQLIQNSTPVSDTCNFIFTLHDALTGGSQLGSVPKNNIEVQDGYFSVNLDFGSGKFTGDARYLGITVNCGSGSTTLSPRVALNPVPYALFSLDTLSYQNVIVVAKSGGDYTSIQAALNSITDASDTNRYLVWVAPGTYNETVTMKQYVDIEGAGELVTKITAASNYTAMGASNAELRFLTVENTGGSGDETTAIYNGSASFRLTHVTATASGGSIANYGVWNEVSSPKMTHVTATAWGGVLSVGVFNNGSLSSPEMMHVTATASGGSENRGVYNANGSSPTMTYVTADASGGSGINRGVQNDAGSPKMAHVTATASGGGTSVGVYNNAASPEMTNVTATASNGSENRGVHNYNSSPTMMDVIATASNGVYNRGVYNDSSSPKMRNVTADASGEGDNRGVFNDNGSSPEMTNVTATASGGDDNRGVNNAYGSHASMTNVTAKAWGGSSNVGVLNYESSPTIQNSVIFASGGTANYGISNGASADSYYVLVNNSQITASTNTINSDDEFTTLVGASMLWGGNIANPGTMVCAGVYDEGYTFYPNTCPP